MREADQLKERVEVLRIEASPRQLQDGMHCLGQLSVHALSDDLTRVKYVADEIEAIALRDAGWAPVQAYAHGEY